MYGTGKRDISKAYPNPQGETGCSLEPPCATGSQSVCAVFIRTVLSDTESVAFGFKVESLSANSIRWLSCKGVDQNRGSTQCTSRGRGGTPEAARCPGASLLADPADPSSLCFSTATFAGHQQATQTQKSHRRRFGNFCALGRNDAIDHAIDHFHIVVADRD